MPVSKDIVPINPARKRRRRPTSSIPDRYQSFIDGEITVDDLDEEEILRGQLRNKNGDFRGGTPNFIPRQMMIQVMARRDQILTSKLQPLAAKAAKALDQMVTNGTTVHDGPRVQAAKLALEYSVGKPVEKVQIQASVKVEQYTHVVESVLVDVNEEEDTL